MPMHQHIVTLTLNPALDETWLLDEFDEERVNRVTDVRIDAAGKGVNVSRLLRILGVDAPAAGFAGGANGDELRSLMQADGVTDCMTGIDGETRRNITLQVRSGSRAIKVNHPGPDIGADEYARLCIRLEEQLAAGDLLAVCGGLPPGVSVAAVADMLEKLSARGIRAAIDSEAFDTAQLTRIHPFLYSPNQREFEALTGERFPLGGSGHAPDEGNLQRLAAKAAKLAVRVCCFVIVSLGPYGVVAAAPAGPRLHVPGLRVNPVSSVGAGDALLGGMLAVLAGYRPEDQEPGMELLPMVLQLGVAAGAAKAETTGSAMPSRERILELFGQTELPRKI